MLHKGKPTEHTSSPDESLLLACCRLNKKASNLKCYRNKTTIAVIDTNLISSLASTNGDIQHIQLALKYLKIDDFITE